MPRDNLLHQGLVNKVESLYRDLFLRHCPQRSSSLRHKQWFLNCCQKALLYFVAVAAAEREATGYEHHAAQKKYLRCQPDSVQSGPARCTRAQLRLEIRPKITPS